MNMKQTVKISPAALGGHIAARPAKSLLHRRIIAAALVENALSAVEWGAFALNEDNAATLKAVEDMGLALVRRRSGGCDIAGGFSPVTMPSLHCGASGATLRFLLPLALARCRGARFYAEPSLLARPQEEFLRLFRQRGAKTITEPGCLLISGELTPGEYQLPGDISSQFASGLLFALPLLDEPSRLVFATPPQSRPYIDLTLDILAQAGIACTWQGKSVIDIPSGQSYRSVNGPVEGDLSHAAFFLLAGALGAGMKISGLHKNSLQGDRAVVDILANAGASVSWDGDIISVERGEVSPLDLDMGDIPDLLPPLAVWACFAEGKSRFYNAGRLRYKESDRLSGLSRELRALGADIEQGPDWLEVRGQGGLRGGVADAHGDHRLAMALAMAGCFCREPITISGAEAVAKSAPEFWEQARELGMMIEGISER